MSRVRHPAWIAAAALAVAAIASPAHRANAQVSSHPPNVSPVFEGWEANADGTFNLVFGYFNRSWDNLPVAAIGPHNKLEPGNPDQGQPTYFLPRRNHFVFRIKVPADFGTKEVIWTVTTLGRTEKAYGTLKPDFMIDDMILMSNIGAGGALSTTPDLVGNKAPVLVVHSPKAVTAKPGEPVELVAVATDDKKPNPRAMPRVLGGDYTLPNSAKGLRFSWFVYRGNGAHVRFDPPQSKVWEDNRDGGNSPWSAGWTNPPIPSDNKWTARAIFSEPGTYTIRGIAHDGGLSSVDDVVVTVRREQ